MTDLEISKEKYFPKELRKGVSTLPCTEWRYTHQKKMLTPIKKSNWTRKYNVLLHCKGPKIGEWYPVRTDVGHEC